MAGIDFTLEKVSGWLSHCGRDDRHFGPSAQLACFVFIRRSTDIAARFRSVPCVPTGYSRDTFLP